MTDKRFALCFATVFLILAILAMYFDKANREDFDTKYPRYKNNEQGQYCERVGYDEDTVGYRCDNLRTFEEP